MRNIVNKIVLVGGATVLLLGMGINLQYALDGYGVMDNKNAVVVWAQQSGDSGESEESDYCSVTLICKDANGSVDGSVSCKGKERCDRNSFAGYVVCDDKAIVRC